MQLNSASAVPATYYNAHDNAGVWTSTDSNGNNSATIGTPALGSTFNSTNGGITPALTVNNGYAGFSNHGAGTVTNTITGGVNISNGGYADFSNSGTGTVTSTITGGINLSNGYADFGNYSNGTATNTITGGITADNSYVYMYKGNTIINNIDTMTLNNSIFYIGGGSNSRTHIDNLNWNSGTLRFYFADGSFGNTTIDTLNIGNGPLIITMRTYNGNYSYTNPSDLHTEQTLFTVGTVTGDPSNITLNNNNPFHEVIATSGAPNGITVSPNGQVTVTLIPTATSATTNHIDALSAASDLLPSLQNTTSQMTNDFAPSAYKVAKARANMTKIMRENQRDSLESLITALAKEDTGTITKIRGDFRVFAAPYVTQIRNNGMGGYMAGYSEKYYGMLVGGSHYFKASGVNLLGMIGFGASKTQQDRSVNSNTNGKNLMLGLDVRKTFVDAWNIGWDFESNLSGIAVKNVQQRQGNPSPSQSYIAVSRYNTYAAAFKNEIGPIFILPHGFSIKPDIGLQVNQSKQTKIQEQNAGIFAQNYKETIARNGEIYGGVGVRKQWKADGFEGKITLKYEVGEKSGNGKSTSTIYTETTPGGVNSTGTKPGKTTHYINLYGSMLDMKSNWKCVPGMTVTLQKGQKSISGTIKFERRF
ncbi:MAG: hypothetical protein V4482_01875 [Pseudomonadota bacterium]